MKKDKRRNDDPGDLRAGEFNNDFNNENQDFDQGSNPEEQGGSNYEEDFEQEQGGGQGRNNRKRNRMEEEQGPMDEEGYEAEDGEEQKGDFDEDGRSGKGFKQIEEVAKKVMAYMKEHSQEFDKKTIAKYAAVGVLMLYGMRKNSVLGSMLVSIAAGVITKYILEKTMDEQERENAQAA